MITGGQVQYLEIDAATAGQRLDNFLLRELKGCPKSRIYRIVRKGEVRINGKRAKPETRLMAGDKVRIPPLRLPERDAPPLPSAGLTALLESAVLFENDDFLVINKPAGLPVHGGSGVRLGLVEALRQIHPRWQGLELVQRLDRGTSGCMVLSKNTIFLKEINAQLKLKSVLKEYLVLVDGYWPGQLKLVDAPLLKNQLESGERLVRVDSAGKQALTRFDILERFGQQATLLKARLETGRTHQIRVHCQHFGHPILGDTKYGTRRPSGPARAIKRLCLHAWRLEFSFPSEGPRFRFEAEPGDDFNGILKSLRSQ